MRAIRLLLCTTVIACGLGIAPVASATAFSTDESDLWYVASESGWGMQLVQRGGTIFATLFVYDAGFKPTWFVATLVYQGDLVWKGDLLATTGPWFGANPYNPSALTIRKAGSMTWTTATVDTGTVTYDVDGVTVVKNVVREPVALDDYSGHYAGASHLDRLSCTNPANNTTIEDLGIIDVSQSGATFRLVSPITGGTCTYNGNASQAGQMGTVTGSYNCINGETGSFTVFEMQVNVTGLTARISSQSPALPGCWSMGWLGGVRVTMH